MCASVLLHALLREAQPLSLSSDATVFRFNSFCDTSKSVNTTAKNECSDKKNDLNANDANETLDGLNISTPAPVEMYGSSSTLNLTPGPGIEELQTTVVNPTIDVFDRLYSHEISHAIFIPVTDTDNGISTNIEHSTVISINSSNETEKNKISACKFIAYEDIKLPSHTLVYPGEYISSSLKSENVMCSVLYFY